VLCIENVGAMAARSLRRTSVKTIGEGQEAMMANQNRQRVTVVRKALKWMASLMLFASVHAIAQSGSTVTYVYTDPQGTPVAEADASGNITATFDYTPYGTFSPTGTSNPGPDPNGPGYTGHVNDPETNLVYMQARYYDPVTGHFLSVDPDALVPGDVFKWNRYGYANANPVRNIDPNGRQALDQSAKYLAAYSDCAAALGCNPADVPRTIAAREGPYADVVAGFLPLDEAVAPIASAATRSINLVLERVQAAQEISAFIKAASVEFKNSGLSVAARKIESHSQRIGGTFAKLSGSISEKNTQAAKIVSDILKSPDAVRTELSGGGVEYRIGQNGQGVRFNKDGSFNTVLDPRVKN
jgi:RHS repeat-associated protein